MEQWYGAFYDNALRGTRLIDPARQYVPDEFDENNLFDPEDSSIANAQLTANEAFRRGTADSAAAMERTIPVGAIVNFPKEPANFSNGGAPGSDTKWLECDGSIYNIADFPDLAAFLGTDFGGDGEATFGVPNYTDDGRFLRSRSSSIAEGDTQDDITSHTHGVGTLAADENGDHNHEGSTGDAGYHDHYGLTGSEGAHSHGGSTDYGGSGNTGSGTSHTHSGSIGASGSHGHTISIIDPTHNHTYFAAAGSTLGATSAQATGIAATASTAADHTHTLSIISESSHTHSLPSHTHTIISEADHTHTISPASDHSHSIRASGTHTHTISGATAANSATPETVINAAAVVICIRT